MKIGDKVRFLSEVGGGIVTGFQGKDFVLVEDADGFDIPMPIRECVVIETDDYNMRRKPGSSVPKPEEPVKPVKPETKRINLRNTPELSFILDQSIEYGVNMTRLINEVTAGMNESGAKEEDSEEELLEDTSNE